ncbi:hypothetical protein [Streptomyces showdoensis]|uniref:Uncharacterized protein n=1 Tax=Streptomyces showdoensis TaxID=68268 RepID=A0A2P2GCS8_STREW|nr:hypothetical protein [Streptomyces showdoensis]KKZ69277.1 hypothetical protein VO63_35130 [Streptomyces showdoensis]
MQRPNAAQSAYGSATVVLATVALLLLSGTTTTLGIAAICAAGLILGVLVAVTMPVRKRPVNPSGGSAAPAPGAGADEEIRVPAARVGAGADTRIRS